VLRWRLLVAAVIVVPLVGLLWADCQWNFGVPGIWLWPLPVLFTLLGVAEVLDLLSAKNLRPAVWSVYCGAMLVACASLVPLFSAPASSTEGDTSALARLAWPLAAFMLSIVLVLVAEMRRYRKPGGAIVNVSLAVFTIAYVALAMSFLIALRLYYDNRWGLAAVISLIFVTKMSDTGAYTFGRLFGRHKMAPNLSPGKTIEGGIGGLVTACLCSLLFFHAALPLLVGPDVSPPPWWASLAYGAIVTVAGVIGDLSESLLKRDMERKDSSRWMPGLGGVLDILDSLLLAAPAGYFCWMSGILGP
jgi:phosphatidate cytidylyltransferase